jgi:hypothetical protein
MDLSNKKPACPVRGRLAGLEAVRINIVYSS